MTPLNYKVITKECSKEKTEYRKRVTKKVTLFKIADALKNYFFTASLNFLPAEKAGTVFAAILIVAPV